MLRAVGMGIWIFIGLPIFDSSTRRGYTLTREQWFTWLAFFMIFGPAFWYSSTYKLRSLSIRFTVLLLETISVLMMTYLLQDYFVGFLLVIVSWQVALVFPLRIAITWMMVASALLIYLLEPHYYMGWRWGATGAFLGFQIFSIVTATLAKAESKSREDQARINADLVSTRELLRESSKLGERMRISHDLHDSIGHHLTAVCLHLEATLNSPLDQKDDGIEQATGAAKQALQEVRSVVSGMRSTSDIDLRSALHLLAERIPRVHLNLNLPEELKIEDTARANTLLQCVQEITTNTLKHSDAANLWITVSWKGGGIEIDARDDGRSIGGKESGLGLKAMKERFEEFGGDVSYQPGHSAQSGHITEERGFSVRAWLPAND